MLVAEGLHARPVIHAAPVGPVRILVVDDHEVLRSGLRWLLTRVGWVERCAVAASGEAGARARGRRGVRRRARRRRPRRRVRARRLRAARGARPDHGAAGLALGPGLAAHGARRRRARRDREGPARPRAAGGGARARGRRRLRAAAGAPGEVRFVPREREILRLVGAGLTNAEIGAALFLAPGTIKHHMLGLYEKLGAPNRAAAVHAARRLGVLADHRVEEPVTGAPGGARRRVLVADPDDVRRTGLLLALHGGVGRARRRPTRWPSPRGCGRRSRSPATRSSAARCGRRASPTLLVRDDEVDAGEPGVVRQWWPAERLADARARAGRPARRAAAPGWSASGGRPARSAGLPRAAAAPDRSPRASTTSSPRWPPAPPTPRSPARSGCRPTPSSSTPPRSSASSARATGPRPSAWRTTSA